MLKSGKLSVGASDNKTRANYVTLQQRESAAKRGYGSRWQKYRERYLREHGLCVMHQQQGRTVLATVVDHIQPHKGDHKLFWDPKNHQALCKMCHDSHKKRLEMSGRVVGCDVDGIPIAPNHHWHQYPRPQYRGGD